MALKVEKQKNETFDSLYRRFIKKMKDSGKFLQLKKIRFHKKLKNKNLSKKSAIRKLKIVEKREYLKKTGQLEEDDRQKRRRY